MLRYRGRAGIGVVGASVWIAFVIISSAPVQAITYGTTDTIHTYVGAIVIEEGLVCSGSLISSQIFLTAGHCVYALMQ